MECEWGYRDVFMRCYHMGTFDAFNAFCEEENTGNVSCLSHTQL